MMAYNVKEEGPSCTECTTSRVDDAGECVGGIVSSVCNDRFDVMSLFVVFVFVVVRISYLVFHNSYSMFYISQCVFDYGLWSMLYFIFLRLRKLLCIS